MGFVVEISAQFSALSLSFIAITFELVIVFTLESSYRAKYKTCLVQKPNEE